MDTKLKRNKKLEYVLEYVLIAMPAALVFLMINESLTYYYNNYNYDAGIFGYYLIAFVVIMIVLFGSMLNFFKNIKVKLISEIYLVGIVISIYIFIYWGQFCYYEKNLEPYWLMIFNIGRYIRPGSGFYELYRNTAGIVGSYVMVLCTYRLIKLFRNKEYIKKSIIYRGMVFLLKRKGIRRTVSIFIIVAIFISEMAALFVFYKISQGSIMFGSYLGFSILALLIMIISIVLVSIAINRRNSVIRDMETICDTINLLSQNEMPDKVEISEKSVLYDSADKLVNISRTMQEAISKGIAGEKLKVELITNVSHDLKTPMTSIVGYGEILEKMELPDEAREYVRRLNHKSRYLLEMLEDVFDLSKASTGNAVMNMAELDLVKLLNQTLAEEDDRLESLGVKVCNRLGENGVIVNTDGNRMHRVFQNLLDNAIKYSLKGSRIFISLAIEADVARVEIMNTSSYEMNFTPERITERFVRGNEARTGEGSGIGLAIAKTYTESCGGQFDIKIKGDTFTAIVSMPVVKIER